MNFRMKPSKHGTRGQTATDLAIARDVRIGLFANNRWGERYKLTAKEVKKQLRSYNRIRADSDMLRRRIEYKKRSKEQLKAVAADGMPHSPTSANQIERIIAEIDELIKRYIDMLVRSEDAELSVLKLIESAPNEDGRSILFLRYIEGKRFEDIPDILHISDRTMWNYYYRTIDEICSKLQ